MKMKKPITLLVAVLTMVAMTAVPSFAATDLSGWLAFNNNGNWTGISVLY